MGIDVSEKRFSLQSRSGKSLLRINGSLRVALEKYKENVLDNAIRPAVYAGADLMFKEMCIRVPVGSSDGPGALAGADASSSLPRATLLNSIYKYFDVRKGTQTKPLYYVGPNMKKAPHWHLIEYGHYAPYKAYKGKDGHWYTSLKDFRQVPKWIAPIPYIRPTYDANAKTVIDVMRSKLRDALDNGVSGASAPEIMNVVPTA